MKESEAQVEGGLGSLRALLITDWDENWEARQPTLRIDLESVAVHVIKAVTFTTEEHDVRRHRWEKEQAEGGKSTDFEGADFDSIL